MSLIPGAANEKSVFPDDIQVNHLNENTTGHGVRVKGISDPTTNPVVTGDIGEALTVVTATVTGGSLAQWATKTIPPGVWLIIAKVMAGGGAAVGTYIDYCLNTISASKSGTTNGYDSMRAAVTASSGQGGGTIVISKSFAVSTPIYINGITDHTTASDIFCSIQAIRIA